MAFSMSSLLQRNKSSPAAGWASEGPWSLGRRRPDDSSALTPQPLTAGAGLLRGKQRSEKRSTPAIRPNWQSAPVLAGPGVFHQPQRSDFARRSEFAREPRVIEPKTMFAETMYATGVLRPQMPPVYQTTSSLLSPQGSNTMVATLQVVRPQSQGAIKRQQPPETMLATLQLHHPPPSRSSGSRLAEPEAMFATGVIRPQSQGTISKPKKLYNVGNARSKQKVRQAMATMDESARLRRFEQVLQDTAVTENKTLAPNVKTMREEAPGLKAKGKARKQVQLDEEDHHARKMQETMATYKEFLDRHEQEQQKEAALKIQKIIRGKAARRRMAKLRTASLISFEDHDVENEHGEVDLRHSKYWSPQFMYVCDIKEKRSDRDNDFLFLADISDDGTMKAKIRRGRCVFNSVMYDIQDFVPKPVGDGKVEFELKFGINTKERRDVPQGWKIGFSVSPSGGGRWEGACNSSWWGTRKVELIQYTTLSDEEKAKYPDLVAKYYKSWTGAGARVAFQSKGKITRAKTTVSPFF